MKHTRIRKLGPLLAMCLMALALVFTVGCGQKAQSDNAGGDGTDPAAQSRPVAVDDDSGGTSAADVQKADAPETTEVSSGALSIVVDESGSYTSKEEVALYIHTYGHLPGNFISKSKAKKAGWVAKKGNLDEVCPGMSIGGSEFYNDEGQLPDKNGRRWTECDINYQGGYRGAERIVFSNDGLIFYTDDHYETFVQLY